MLCSVCGGDLAVTGETADGETVYECVECGTQYVQPIGGGGADGPPPAGELPLGMDSAAVEEVILHVYSGDIDYRLRDYRGETYICPHCKMLLSPDWTGPNGASVFCSECQEERDWTGIGQFSTVSYLFHRFGIQYAETLEADIGPDIDSGEDLPPTSPEAIWAASVIVPGILTGASWSAITSRYDDLKDRVSAATRDETQSLPAEPINMPNVSYRNKIMDLLIGLLSEESSQDLEWWGFTNLASAYAAAQEGLTASEYRARTLANALSEALGREVSPEDAEEMSEEFFAEADGRDVSVGQFGTEEPTIQEVATEHLLSNSRDLVNLQMEIMHGKLGAEVPSPLEITSLAEMMAVDPSYVGTLEEEFHGLTRSEVISEIHDGFTRSLVDSMRLFGLDRPAEFDAI